MSRLDEQLLPLFIGQHGLVTVAQVEAAGGSRRAASRRVCAGTWAQADVNVYRLTALPITWHARTLAPILAIGHGAVASHFAAAALHGISGFGRGTPEISIPRGLEHRRRGEVVVHTSTDLDRADPAVIDGIPTTGLGRTILDLSRRQSDRSIALAIEWSRRRGRADWAEMIRVLERHARRGRPGIRRLRRVILSNMDREEVIDSDFELLVLSLLAERGLPTPVLHHKVFAGDRFVAEVDLAYPALKIAIELDGRVHLEEEVWQRDLPRQNDLVLEGWIVLRFTWARFVARPEHVVREVRDALDRAMRRV
jgi:hypothetical protein